MVRLKLIESEMPILSQQLLLSVAEELKLPLQQIAGAAEKIQLVGESDAETNRLILDTASSALKLIDNYVLGVRLSLEPAHLNIEAVSVSSVLYDVGEQLHAMACNYDVELELNICGKYGPVVANRQGLQAALVSLGMALIEAMPAMENQQLKLQLATHRSRYGVVAGVYSSARQVSTQALSLGRKLQYNSRQPLVNLTHTSGAGVFIANNILKAMDLNLTASRHHRLYGLGTVLQSNNQLQLVS